MGCSEERMDWLVSAPVYSAAAETNYLKKQTDCLVLPAERWDGEEINILYFSRETTGDCA